MTSITYIPFLQKFYKDCRRCCKGDGKLGDLLIYREGRRMIVEQRVVDAASIFIRPDDETYVALSGWFKSAAHADLFIRLNARAFKWTALDRALAQSQGWDVFDKDSTGVLEIQRLDELNMLSSDLAAINLVGRQAPFSFHAAKALWLHEPYAAELRKELSVGQLVVAFNPAEAEEPGYYAIAGVRSNGVTLSGSSEIIPLNQIFP